MGLDDAGGRSISGALGGLGILGIGAQTVELGVAFHPARFVGTFQRSAVGGYVDLLTGSVGTCRYFTKAPIELGPCGSFELGRLHAQGYGVTDPGDGGTLWAALEASGALAFRLVPRVALALRLGAAVPLLRPRFVLDNVGSVYQPPAVLARGSAGVEIVF